MRIIKKTELQDFPKILIEIGYEEFPDGKKQTTMSGVLMEGRKYSWKEILDIMRAEFKCKVVWFDTDDTNTFTMLIGDDYRERAKALLLKNEMYEEDQILMYKRDI